MDIQIKLPVFKIDSEFKALIRQLSDEEKKLLEESIIKDGCRDAIVTWEGIIIDGHNRYEICHKHVKFFKEATLKFNAREEVIKWIIQNQLARRNLSPDEIAYYRGKLYNETKKSIPNADGKNQHTNEVDCQNGNQPKKNTAEEIAQKEGVSPRTVIRDGQFAENVDAIAKATNTPPLEVASSVPKNVAGAIANLPTEEQKKHINFSKNRKRKPKSKPKPKKTPSGERTARRFITLPISRWNLIDSVDIDSRIALEKIIEDWKTDCEKKAVAAANETVTNPKKDDVI